MSIIFREIEVSLTAQQTKINKFKINCYGSDKSHKKLKVEQMYREKCFVNRGIILWE